MTVEEHLASAQSIANLIDQTLLKPEATSQKIDSEVRRLINQGWEDAKRILTDKHDDLEALAKALLEFETLSGDEIVNALKGVKPNRDEAETRAMPGPRVSVPLAPRPDPELA